MCLRFVDSSTFFSVFNQKMIEVHVVSHVKKGGFVIGVGIVFLSECVFGVVVK